MSSPARGARAEPLGAAPRGAAPRAGRAAGGGPSRTVGRLPDRQRTGQAVGRGRAQRLRRRAHEILSPDGHPHMLAFLAGVRGFRRPTWASRRSGREATWTARIGTAASTSTRSWEPPWIWSTDRDGGTHGLPTHRRDAIGEWRGVDHDGGVMRREPWSDAADRSASQGFGVDLNWFAAEVSRAERRLGGVSVRTPLQRNARLSDVTGADVRIKREDLQVGRSYKLRGAYNTISQLDDGSRAAGVVCASAGNHGQGVAYACRSLGVRGHVFVPRTTPRQKRDRIASLGRDMVDLVMTGDSYDKAAAAALAHARSTAATLIPAFDAVSTVVGQATVALEILEQLDSPPDVVVLPVGGGGLLAGCATWLRIHSPNTRIVGVEPAGAANMAAALAAGAPVDLPEIDTFVDGAAVRRAGDVTFPLIRDAGS